METPPLTGGVGVAELVDADRGAGRAQYFFHRLCAASWDSGPPRPLMLARNSGRAV
jgi:hypothetical protein